MIYYLLTFALLYSGCALLIYVYVNQSEDL
jgi:hypothetical protein